MFGRARLHYLRRRRPRVHDRPARLARSEREVPGAPAAGNPAGACYVRSMRRIGIPLERVPDEALLAGLMTGDPEIAVAFVRRFQHRVFGVAVAVVGDIQLAEDIAQQTFERACRRRPGLRPAPGIGAHLAVGHRTQPRDRRRTCPQGHSGRPADLENMMETVADTPERHALSAEAAADLRRAVGKLPREQARALVMAGIYGMTAQQVADFEQIPLGTAKTRIRAAMGKVRASLATRQVDHD